MNPSIPKDASSLPQHSRGPDGGLHPDLLSPAPRIFRESYIEGFLSERVLSLELYKTHLSRTSSRTALLPHPISIPATPTLPVISSDSSSTAIETAVQAVNIARRSSSGINRQGTSQPLLQIEPSWRNGERQVSFFSPNGLSGDGQLMRIGSERGMYVFMLEMIYRKREDGGELDLSAKRI